MTVHHLPATPATARQGLAARPTGSGTASRNGAGTPQPEAELDLEATRVAVAEHLDSALARLDRALPAGADGALGQALADARRYLEQARDVLITS